MKFYEPGTASASGSTTSGTPFAGNLYAAVSGGSPISTTQTTDNNGELTVFTTARQRFDVGFEYSTGARVTTYESVEFDPADVVTLTDTQTLTSKTLAAPAVTGQMTVAEGTASAPSIAKTGDTDTGVNLLSTANILQLVSGGVAAVVANADSTTGLVRIDRDGNTDASLLSLTQSNGSGGVASSKPALSVSRYTDGGGSAIFGGAYGSDGTGGSVVGGEFLAQVGTDWDPTGGLVIGIKSDANAYRSDAKLYGANIFAWAVDSSATNATIVGIEVDLGGRTGSTVAARYGIQVVSPDLATVQASGEDVAYRVAAKSLAATFKTGFLIDHNGGKWPIDATGTLIDARTGTVTNGIDFSTMTFTGATFKGPATNINGVGRLRLGSSSAATGTMLEINAVGDETYNMVFSNAVSAGSAGSIAEYMTIRFNGVTRKIALYANS